MLVQIIADHSNKISDLRTLLGSEYRVSSALLNDENIVPVECRAVIIAADLRIADKIAALKAISLKYQNAPRRIFVIDHKARLFAAQAYALGATHVLFNPVDQRDLLTVIAETGKPSSADAHPGVRAIASGGAATLASMFSAVLNGRTIDVGDAKQAASKIANTIAEEGLSCWLDTVRRHHEGTYQHCLLVTGTAVDFGLSLGLAKADIERLYSAAMFHDIGKAKIPLVVLDKPGRLDAQERALIETHPAAGFDILKGTCGISSEILDAVRHHHEYLDGSGYPDALCATDISDIVRVLTVSDIFAALIEDRRYKPPMTRVQAYDILCGMREKLEAPLVAAFKATALSR